MPNYKDIWKVVLIHYIDYYDPDMAVELKVRPWDPWNEPVGETDA